ncbi:hypothetical protein JOB18_002449 [Solea senegalensis]|uniref:Phosphatidic acid phosphatase type 2/haloperoxidase domain-containing protein n=1 Tax=Solea senegalensis TaxID=28829 RepID=A0AAV6Q5F3_SOLSE|nr:hypothetical protein JOB18_002449 [Solea senegalensis]
MFMLDGFGPQSGGVSASNAELHLKVADNHKSSPPAAAAAAAGMRMENSGGKKLLDISGAALSKRKLLVGLDLLCLFLASIPFFACELKAVSPYRRGFMCGDPSITYPYLPQEAIPDELLIAGGIIITGVTIALGECYRVRFQGVSSKAFVTNLYVSRLYKELGCFLFGCCVGQSLTNMAKLSVGRLRPHFLSVCGVTYASLNCTPGSYVATVSCRQSDHRSEEEEVLLLRPRFLCHVHNALFSILSAGTVDLARGSPAETCTAVLPGCARVLHRFDSDLRLPAPPVRCANGLHTGSPHRLLGGLPHLIHV